MYPHSVSYTYVVHQKKLIEDVPEEESHAALIDEDFEDLWGLLFKGVVRSQRDLGR